MLEFWRALRSRQALAARLPGLLLAFLVAEAFYKFGSFAMECAAFLATWFAIDWLIERVALRLGRRADRPDER